jgi:hypothetical protein
VGGWFSFLSGVLLALLPPTFREHKQQYRKKKNMKTALIKTSFWDDDIIYELNIDTKLLYLFLNTAPERNTTRFYKLPDRLISAHVGISDNALKLCKSQLEEKELVFFVDGWVVLGDSSYVQPAKGKQTRAIYRQDIQNIPAHIKQLALDRSLDFELSTEDSSGATPEEPQEYKDIYKDKSKTSVGKVVTLGVEYKGTSDIWEENPDDPNAVNWKR